MITHVEAYLISVGAGTIVTLAWSQCLHCLVQKYKVAGDKPGERVWWFPAIVGVFERLLYTTLVIFEVSGAGAFVGSWVMIKALGGWANWSKDGSTYGRALFSAGLLGSAMSALFGIVPGVMALAKP